MDEAKKTKSAARTTAKVFLILAALMAFFGVLSWPPGGLMFALPYFFFLLALIFSAIGGLILLIQRFAGSSAQAEKK